MSKLMMLSFAAAAASACAWGHGAVLSLSPTAPASAPIAQPDFADSGTSFGRYTDQFDFGTGQQFVATAGTPTLNSVTFKGVEAGGNLSVGTLTLYSAGGTFYTAPLVRIASETVNLSAAPSGATGYLTLTFATPLPLVAGNLYMIGLDTRTANGNSGGFLGLAAGASGGDAYTSGNGGLIYNDAGTTPPTVRFGQFLNDKTFFINAAVPEPATLSALAGLAALMTRRRRRAC